MQGMLYAFLGTLFTFGITALGALNVFAAPKRPSDAPLCAGKRHSNAEKTDHAMEALTLGFAGGVMCFFNLRCLDCAGECPIFFVSRADILQKYESRPIPIL